MSDPTLNLEIVSLENGSKFRAERVIFDRSLSGLKIVPTWGALITITNADGSFFSFRLMNDDPRHVANTICGGTVA